MNIPYISLRNFDFDEQLVRLLPETMARRFRAMVLREENGSLIVGMADPMDLFAYDELARVLQKPVDLAVVRESDLLDAMDLVYRRTEQISSLAEELHDELGEDQFDLGQLAANDDDEEAPVVRLLQTIFEDALQVGASDIHIEPDEKVLRVRQRWMACCRNT